MSILAFSLEAVERGLVPDVITRAAIRKLLWHFRRDVGSTVSNPARVTSDAASRSLVQPPWCRVLPRCPWCLALPRCLVLLPCH